MSISTASVTFFVTMLYNNWPGQLRCRCQVLSERLALSSWIRLSNNTPLVTKTSPLRSVNLMMCVFSIAIPSFNLYLASAYSPIWGVSAPSHRASSGRLAGDNFFRHVQGLSRDALGCEFLREGIFRQAPRSGYDGVFVTVISIFVDHSPTPTVFVQQPPVAVVNPF